MVALQQATVWSCIALAVMLATVPGCRRTATLQFQMVDAQSHQPLEGVKVKHHAYVPDLLRHGRQDLIVPPTGADGMVTAEGAIVGMAHEFVFEKEGYLSAAVAPNLRHGQALVSSQTSADRRESKVVETNGVIVIPMYPATRPAD